MLFVCTQITQQTATLFQGFFRYFLLNGFIVELLCEILMEHELGKRKMR
jgi:hypothetical protein